MTFSGLEANSVYGRKVTVLFCEVVDFEHVNCSPWYRAQSAPGHAQRLHETVGRIVSESGPIIRTPWGLLMVEYTVLKRTGILLVSTVLLAAFESKEAVLEEPAADAQQLNIESIAEEQLVENFDIREFHDRILENGSMTLPMMEKAVLAWIENTRGTTS